MRIAGSAGSRPIDLTVAWVALSSCSHRGSALPSETSSARLAMASRSARGTVRAFDMNASNCWVTTFRESIITMGRIDVMNGAHLSTR